MKITSQKTVAEIVTENIKTAHVFKRYGIDFCCGGGVSVEKVCQKHDIDYASLEKELNTVDKNLSKEYDYDRWTLDFLVDHIVNIHHKYIEESIPMILQYARKVEKVYGASYKEVIDINNLFTEVAEELTTHLKKEELILFPYIKQLIKSDQEGTNSVPPDFDTIDNPIKMLENEHESAGDIFKTIAQVSNNYTPPESACNTFRALYAKLDEFEQDLHQHIHLENNILFPKSRLLETKLK